MTRTQQLARTGMCAVAIELKREQMTSLAGTLYTVHDQETPIAGLYNLVLVYIDTMEKYLKHSTSPRSRQDI